MPKSDEQRELRTTVVVNENAGGGAMADTFRRVEHRLDQLVGDYDIAFTDRPGHAIELTREALRGGAERILVAGGDGTVHETVNGFFDEEGAPIAPDACLGMLAGGTGGDLRKTLGIPDMDAALRVIAEGHTRRIDVGRVEYEQADGGRGWRCFVNIASLGMSGLVDRYVKRFGALPGKAAYVAASFVAMLGYRNPVVHLTVDDTLDVEMPVSTVAVANGRFFGGGMKIAPIAELDDGRFEVTILGDLSKLELLQMTGRIYTGAHVHDPKVMTTAGRIVTAESREDVWLDIDGEPLGKLPARFEVVPGALKVLAPQYG